jgi:thiol-disulfide isomerase/thioredoxin
LAVLLLAACDRRPASESQPAPTESTTLAAERTSPPLVLARGVRFVDAPSGDAADVIRAERTRAIADGRTLVVYVGAKWCEPCQRFHQAAERGALDAEFPNLTFLAFDLDEARDRLIAAGYSSKLIPLFVLPDESGRATERRFEGGVKGDGAVANITPRLRALLAK